MADIDPKELVQRNIVLVVLYVLAVVPIILWFVLVGGGVKGEKGRRANSFDAKALQLRKSERAIKSLLAKIKNTDPEQRPFTQAHIKKFQELHAAYESQITELRDVVAKRDGDLDRWFPDADPTRGLEWSKLPKANDYITAYNDQITALVREYSDLVVPEGGGTPRVYKQPPDKKQMRLYQKRFWIQKYLLQALREGTNESKQAGLEGARIEQAVRFGELGTGRPADEEEEPIVEPIGVSVSFTCLFRDVPKVIERILAQPITFQVLSMKVTKAGFMIEKNESNLRIDGRDTTFSDPYYTAELEDHDKFKGDDKLEEYIPEPPISVSLELEVLDFNVKKEEKKEEPAEEDEGEAPEDDGAGS